MGREGEGTYQEGGPWAEEAERLEALVAFFPERESLIDIELTRISLPSFP
jgi:hypothetical protein